MPPGFVSGGQQPLRRPVESSQQPRAFARRDSSNSQARYARARFRLRPACVETGVERGERRLPFCGLCSENACSAASVCICVHASRLTRFVSVTMDMHNRICAHLLYINEIGRVFVMKQYIVSAQ